MIDLAPSIIAFGNKNPTSYFRLVPHQEAPTNVCWGDRNRSVLVRVPLGWAADVDMCRAANPLEPAANYDTSIKQTVEMRSPDGSADLYQLLAGLCVASANCLQRQRSVFEEYGVFSPAMIDGIIEQLRSFDDAQLRRSIANKPEEIQKLVNEHFHCG
jgi:glutamine synthetase